MKDLTLLMELDIYELAILSRLMINAAEMIRLSTLTSEQKGDMLSDLWEISDEMEAQLIRL